MKAKRRGFTLIEMLVVMAIIAIVSMAVAPEILNSLEVRSLENSAREVLNSMERAKSQSVRTKLNHRVRFDNSLGHWRYLIERETSPGTWEQMPRSVSKIIPGGFVITVNLPDADSSVEFSSLGFIVNFEKDKNSIILQSEKLRQMNQPDLRSVVFFRGGS
ncbi:MAG: prepilin-type N-terminal cleavage/methylation domain-containing protein, partial [Candidatus Aminicenantes bacterium]|nr:prepilin-type N-terminal cleavage/methylation domain-containing protein [Candidatus Aminicenantes bacterium]